MSGFDPGQALAEERRATLVRLADLSGDFEGIVAASADSNGDDEHDPEGTTIAYERSQVGTLIEQAREHLSEIDAAEERLAAGSFGICEGCGEPIAPGRLEARPVARTCIDCASRS